VERVKKRFKRLRVVVKDCKFNPIAIVLVFFFSSFCTKCLSKIPVAASSAADCTAAIQDVQQAAAHKLWPNMDKSLTRQDVSSAIATAMSESQKFSKILQPIKQEQAARDLDILWEQAQQAPLAGE
jgi:hypothetical protein